MPLKLNCGLSQKVGLPHYGSLGASCHVELELEQSLLFQDPDGWQEKLRQVFDSCRHVVQEELRRGQQDSDPVQTHDCAADGQGVSPGTTGGGASKSSTPPRCATGSQVRAIESIAHRQGLDLAALLRSQFGIEQPHGLSRQEASRLIDQLQEAAAVA